jgi:hypothetical protein
MHEQSETIQTPRGTWINVYGLRTRTPGLRLPGSGEYNTLEEAVEAAKMRSQSGGRSGLGQPKNIDNLMPGDYGR